MKKTPIILLLLTIILTGCLHPQSNEVKKKFPSEAEIAQVQNAVDQFRDKKDGLVPIKTKSSETPIFQKYLIDFDRLKNEGLLADLPHNSFEKGGYYQYTLINPEDDPTVKVFDLRITQTLQEIHVKLDDYLADHSYLPMKDSIGSNFFTIDFEKLGYETPPEIVSPYSQDQLPVIMDATGKLFVDYRIDLNNELQNGTNIDLNDDDIRYLLVKDSPFVPAYSPRYTISDGEPVFK